MLLLDKRIRAAHVRYPVLSKKLYVSNHLSPDKLGRNPLHKASFNIWRYPLRVHFSEYLLPHVLVKYPNQLLDNRTFPFQVLNVYNLVLFLVKKEHADYVELCHLWKEPWFLLINVDNHSVLAQVSVTYSNAYQTPNVQGAAPIYFQAVQHLFKAWTCVSSEGVQVIVALALYSKRIWSSAFFSLN